MWWWRMDSLVGENCSISNQWRRETNCTSMHRLERGSGMVASFVGDILCTISVHDGMAVQNEQVGNYPYTCTQELLMMGDVCTTFLLFFIFSLFDQWVYEPLN